MCAGLLKRAWNCQRAQTLTEAYSSRKAVWRLQPRDSQPLPPYSSWFDDTFLAPHFSLLCGFLARVSSKHTDLDVLATSDVAGVYLASTKTSETYLWLVTLNTFALQWIHPWFRWRHGASHPYQLLPERQLWTTNRSRAGAATGHLLFSNWLNYCVYQQRTIWITSELCRRLTIRYLVQ